MKSRTIRKIENNFRLHNRINTRKIVKERNLTTGQGGFLDFQDQKYEHFYFIFAKLKNFCLVGDIFFF